MKRFDIVDFIGTSLMIIGFAVVIAVAGVKLACGISLIMASCAILSRLD